MKTLWKVFKKDLKSNNGNIKWEIGKWQRHNEWYECEECSDR